MDERLTVVCPTREQLYQELWTLTGQELRIRYGASAYRLDEICRTHRLPTPPMGCWVKVRHGSKVRRRPLPELADTALPTIRLLLLEPDVSRCRLSRDPVLVPETLSDPHPLVRAVQQTCGGGGSGGAAHKPPKDVAVEFTVAAECRERALRVLEALVRAFEAAGGEIFAAPTGRLWGRPPDGVGLSLWTDGPPGEPGASPRLCLDLTTNRLVGIKSHWADMKSQRLEGALRPVVNGIFETAARLRWERLDRECAAGQAEKMAAVQRRQAEEARAAEELRAFGRGLAEEAARFQEAQAIRRYVRAARRRLSREAADGTTPAADEDWLRRASLYADSIDPLVRRLPAPGQGSPATPLPIDALDISSGLRMRLAELGVADTKGLYDLKRERLGAYYDRELWAEVCRTLEICGYDLSGRKSSWGGYL